MVPGRDLSVDEVHSREQPHFSTKSLGVSNYGYREKARAPTTLRLAEVVVSKLETNIYIYIVIYI